MRSCCADEGGVVGFRVWCVGRGMGVLGGDPTGFLGCLVMSGDDCSGLGGILSLESGGVSRPMCTEGKTGMLGEELAKFIF